MSAGLTPTCGAVLNVGRFAVYDGEVFEVLFSGRGVILPDRNEGSKDAGSAAPDTRNASMYTVRQRERRALKKKNGGRPGRR